MSPKVLGEGKGFQDEPDEEKVLPPNGWTSCLSCVDNKPYFSLGLLSSPGLGVCSMAIIIPNNGDYRTMVLKHLLTYFQSSHLNYICI